MSENSERFHMSNKGATFSHLNVCFCVSRVVAVDINIMVFFYCLTLSRLLYI